MPLTPALGSTVCPSQVPCPRLLLPQSVPEPLPASFWSSSSPSLLLHDPIFLVSRVALSFINSFSKHPETPQHRRSQHTGMRRMSSKKADPKAASEKWLTSLPGAKPGAAAGESDPRSSTDLGRPLCSCQGCAQETLPSESGFQEISELGSGKPGQTCQPPRKAGQPATRPPEGPEVPPGPRRPASCCCQVGARTELPGTGRPVQVAARAATPWRHLVSITRINCSHALGLF
eukprot:XP_022282576.1 uncharacterized protein LOC111098588 isoform X2 [Canis lupus familiaris]